MRSLSVVCLLLAACSNWSAGKGPGNNGDSDDDAACGGCDTGQFCSVSLDCLPDGSCFDDRDCGAALVCEPTAKVCEPGGECGWQEAEISAVPPNLFISLDRSCSMRNNSKWDIAVTAINTMTEDFRGDIRFGLALFPDLETTDCGQGAIEIPVDWDNETAIQDLLTASLDTSHEQYPSGPCVTNIDTAMEQASNDTTLDDPERDSFVVLITDGKQYGCNDAGGDNGTELIIEDLWLNRSIGTFVLGFGSGVDPDQLNEFADRGGVPSGDPTTRYYDADDQVSLDAALATIASQTLGCAFALDQIPENDDIIWVFFDDSTEPTARDPSHTNGWDYDEASNRVVFYGATCDSLRDGTIAEVDVVLGCYDPPA